MDDLKFGQKCLLHGLTKLCCPQPADDCSSTFVSKRKRVNYGKVSEMVQHIGAKGKDISIKAKMEGLFHFNPGSSTSRPSSFRNAHAEETGNHSDNFHPIPQNPSSRSKKSGNANILLNVKKCCLKVVTLPRIMSQVPPPQMRHMQKIWIPVTANEDEVKSQISHCIWLERE